VGYDAWIVDHLANNKMRMDPNFHDDFIKEGRIIGLEEFDPSQLADLICWHSWIPDTYMRDGRYDLIMFLHGMPSFLFYNELYGGEAAFQFLKKAEQSFPHCHFFISLWPSHRPYWENIFRERLIVTEPIIDPRSVALKSDSDFDPCHMRLAVMDSWRAGKEPYYILNAVQQLMAQHRSGVLGARVTLDVYGKEIKDVQSVWHALIREEFKNLIRFSGRADPQTIFDTHDIILTQVGDTPTESRVIREAMLAGIPVVSGYGLDEWTEFRHDCRDIIGYSSQIVKCWEKIQDPDVRRLMHRVNRSLACKRYSTANNCEKIFRCYESVFREKPLNRKDHASAPGHDSEAAAFFGKTARMVENCAAEQPLSALIEAFEKDNHHLTEEEAIIRFLVDLPASG
jgi:hypothetical protein